MLRRHFLFALLLAGMLPLADGAWAKDGDSGSSGSGSDNSGSGSDSSGSGSGGDDDDDDDDEAEDDNDAEDSGNSGSGSQNSGKYKDQYGAQAAVESGRAIPLEAALKKLRQRYPGRVISVNLGESGKRLVYWFKVKSDNGIVRKVVMDAKTGKIRGLLGFGGS